MRALLGSVVTKNIMFLHAILGCDTTSGVCDLDKKLSISKIKSDSQFQDQAKVFMNQGANKDDIISVGETTIVCLYNGNPHHGINVLRYEKLCVKAATSTVPVQPGPLPPTSGSVKYHSLRVYHQIQEWLGVEMSYVDWGWKLSAGNLLPIMTDLQPSSKSFVVFASMPAIACADPAGTMR